MKYVIWIVIKFAFALQMCSRVCLCLCLWAMQKCINSYRSRHYLCDMNGNGNGAILYWAIECTDAHMLDRIIRWLTLMFFHCWQHIVCALSRQESELLAIFELASQHTSTNHTLVFPFRKNRHNIFQNVENRKHFRNQSLFMSWCARECASVFIVSFFF